eukprot:m.532224 g.532224  ORF g.532224 m.532224 type:complete len:84 (-) comp57593_c0_seq3:295-546(-)
MLLEDFGHEAIKLIALEEVRCDLALTIPNLSVCIEDAVAEQIERALVEELSLQNRAYQASPYSLKRANCDPSRSCQTYRSECT